MVKSLLNSLKPLNFKVNKILKQALFIAPVLFMTCYSLSCKRTEDEIFQQDENFDFYQWENNPSLKIFEAPDSFSISPLNIHQFPINSIAPNTSKETKIQAVLFGDFDTQDTLIIFCNGGQYHMDYYYEQIKTLYYSGGKGKYNILTFDYQGLGSSRGESSFDAMIKDAEAVGQWIEENGISSDQIVLYGQGLGSLAACHLAEKFSFSQGSPKKLILENPIANTDFLISSGLQLNLPSSYFNQTVIDNIALIANYDGDLLLLLSENDEKYNQNINGEALFDAHKGNLKIREWVNSSHSGLVTSIGFTEFMALVDSFIFTP